MKSNPTVSDYGEHIGLDKDDHLSDASLGLSYVNEFIDTTSNEIEIKSTVLRIIEQLDLGKGKNGKTSLEDLTLIHLKGALTNVIYKVEIVGCTSLLLRIFGDKKESAVDRIYEMETLHRLKLASINGPQVLGIFKNGRVEAFFEGFKSCEREEVRDLEISKVIAMRFKKLHSKVILRGKETEPICWTTIDKWLHIFETTGEKWIENDKNIKQMFLCNNWAYFKEHIFKYKEWILGFETGKELKFCHNDLQQGNIIHLSQRERNEEASFLKKHNDD